MQIVIAMDSFKGSISSLAAGQAVETGIRRVFAEAGVQVCPLADGGEGTVEVLTKGMGGSFRQVVVTGPLGEKVPCRYGILQDRVTAVLEMSGAAGLTLVPAEKRNPLYTTTYGVGEAIRDAILQGCRKFIIGIGGSATNDGGVGMLQALGFDFWDAEKKPVPYGAKGLACLETVGMQNVLPQLSECSFHVACDVKNVLCGPSGCSAVFGPQKGADAQTVEKMDRWLDRYACLAAKVCKEADPLYPGAGAAGGLGFALRTFLHASLEPGVSLVLRETGLEEKLAGADLVITGEGRLDGQTAMGKAPAGVAALAKKYGKPVVAFAGCIAGDAGLCHAQGIDAYFPILRGPMTAQEAMEPGNAIQNVADAAEQVCRLWSALC